MHRLPFSSSFPQYSIQYKAVVSTAPAFPKAVLDFSQKFVLFSDLYQSIIQHLREQAAHGDQYSDWPIVSRQLPYTTFMDKCYTPPVPSLRHDSSRLNFVEEQAKLGIFLSVKN